MSVFIIRIFGQIEIRSLSKEERDYKLFNIKKEIYMIKVDYYEIFKIM
jgi:hypothetical protein